MIKKHRSDKPEKSQKQAATEVRERVKPEPKYDTINLGLDVHLDTIQVVRMIDNSRPQPAQRFGIDDFLIWAAKLKGQAKTVHSCYEAGPFGYGLHRKLEAMGVANVVVAPCLLDEQRKGVNNDSTDALALATRLDRRVAGNDKALAVVRVPTEAEEQRRHWPRMRESLVNHRRSFAASGRSVALLHEYRVNKKWWAPKAWEQLASRWPAFLVGLLEPQQRILLAIQTEIEGIEKRIAQQKEQERQKRQEDRALKQRPKGLGPTALETIESEICDWSRFSSAKKIGSYSGLCPGVSASGKKSCALPITKHGNRRLRTALIELAWRWVQWQPQCRLVRKWWKVLGAAKSAARQRKRAIVAMARQLVVDLWRWRTGKMTPEQLGWTMVED